MTDDINSALQRLNKALALIEQRLATDSGLSAHPALDSPLDQACVEITAAIISLKAYELPHQQAYQHEDSINGAPSDTFRTKLKVKDGGILIAERIPTLQSAETKDDLTRIRGIDDTLARRLMAIGVTRYAQIATWRVDDVRGVASALGLGRAISQQNWIEQAQLLQGIALPSSAEAVPAVEAIAEPATVATSAAAETARLPAPTRSQAVVPSIALDDILAVIRAGSLSRRTAENIASAQLRRQIQPPPADLPLAQPVAAPASSPPVQAATIEPATASSVQPQQPVMSPLSINRPAAINDAPSQAVVPIHELATLRLDVLEAEITTLGSINDDRRPNTDPLIAKRPLANLWHPQPNARRLSAPDPIPPVAGEADVKIVIRRSAMPDPVHKQTVIKPLSPPREPAARLVALKPRQAPVEAPPTMDVEEASVVIVKRPIEKSLNSEAAKTGTSATAGTTDQRRFVRNLTSER